MAWRACQVVAEIAPGGTETWSNATCSCQSQVMMAGPVMVNSQTVPVPDGGTAPAPCQPMQAVRTPLVPAAG